MNCPKCGAAIPERATSCPECRTSLNQDPDATWAGSISKPAAANARADDVTNAGFSKPKSRPQVASDVLTPPPGFIDRKTQTPPPSDDATWAGGANSPTFGPSPRLGPEAATLGPNSPTLDRNFGGSTPTGWGTAAAPALGGPIDFGPRYRVEKLLGQGGMGAVYKAYDLDLDRMVALKLVRPELMVHAETMARFRQELLLASKISHRNILRIHDLGDAAGMKFISMAYVDGEDLHHVLLREGRLPLPRMMHIAKQLCSALDAAHSENVVHRDLKPQNIMLGSGDLVQVSDFGLAKSIGADAVTGMTQSGEMLGTPRYMAPEQVEAKTVDSRTDIYALGLIFYEMVTGDVPFTAETTLQLMYKRAHESPPPPNTVIPDIPQWLNNIIVKCLECDPARRYQSARDILNDLENERGPDTAPRKVQDKSAQVTFTVPAARKTWVISGALAIVLLGSTLALPPVRHALFGGKNTQQQAQPVLKSMAVLPLRVIGDSSQDMITADGIVETLGAKFFQLKDVHLASPSDVARLKPGMSPEEIGKTLGVTLLVQGTYQTQGDKFRLILTLDDVKSGKRLWTSPFDGRQGDIFTIEDDVYNKLLTALNLNPGSDERARTSGHATYKIAAYESYLRGRNAMRGNIDEAAAQTALGYYERALKEDPEFALAYAGIADANLRMYKQTKDPKWSDKAVAAAERAGQLGPNVPEVHFVLSSAYAATGKSVEAIAEINRALQLAPNSDEGYRRLGDALRASDEDGAIAAYKKAIDINPYYWYNYNALGTACFRFGGRDEQAIAAYKKVIEVAPSNPLGYANLGAVYVRAGRYDEAAQQFQAALKIDSNSTIALDGLGNAYFFKKQYAEAAQIWEKLIAITPTYEAGMGNLADAYRWSGNKEKANATYDRAIALALKALQVNPRDADSLSSLALYYAKKGDAATAQQYIRRARAVNSEDKDLIYYRGVIEALAGQDDEAVKSVSEAIAKGYPVAQAQTDPDFARLMSRP
ncbi:MAG: protein kinase domain-containing protein, partial [Terriglobales bacterium]